MKRLCHAQRDSAFTAQLKATKRSGHTPLCCSLPVSLPVVWNSPQFGFCLVEGHPFAVNKKENGKASRLQNKQQKKKDFFKLLVH